MYKKNSWIAALLVALSFSIFFIGCVDPLAVEPPDTETYTEFELTKFNAWGSNAENQQGWGSDGAKWDSDKKTVESIGLTVETFQKAKYLVLEMNDQFPKNNVETIWESWDADGVKIGNWVQFSNICTSDGTLNPGFGTGDKGGTYKLEMAKIIKNYSVFRDSSTAAITLIIQHWGNGGTGACIKSAKLLIPDTPEPVIPVTDITGVRNKGFVTDPLFPQEFALTATVEPSDATKQKIIWSIIGFLPEGQTDVAANWLTVTGNAGTPAYSTSKAALLAKVDFKVTTRVVTPAKTFTDYSVLPPEEKVVDPAVTTPWKSDDVIVAYDKGKVKVRATIVEGGADEDDYTQDFVITFIDPEPLTFKIGTADASTKDWGAAANTGNTSIMEVETGGKITLDFSAGYGNCYYYFAVDFGTASSFGNYSGVKFKYKGVSDDYNFKSLRVMAMAAAPTEDNLPSDGLYNPGVQVGTTGETGQMNDGSGNPTIIKDLDAKFDFLTGDSDLGKNNKVYIWFIPWSGAVKYEISDIEFYKDSIPYKLGDEEKTSTEYQAFDNDGQGIVGHSYIRASANGFIAGYGGNNGNSYSYFKVDFGSDKFSDYEGVKFKFSGTDEDGSSSFASIRVKASPTMPGVTYAPGEFIGWLGATGDTLTAKNMDVKFGWNSLVNPPDQTTNINTSLVNDKSVVYFWIYTQNGKSITFNITDIEFYKPEP